MFTSVKNFFYERRQGLTKATAVIGGAYAVRGYMRDRLDEVKDRLEQERTARENLSRRFKQTQDNVSYTVLALIQTLSEQVFREMDVEGLTAELQNRSKARHANRHRLERPPSSLASSIDVIHDQETRSDTASVIGSVASTSYGVASTSNLSTSSWAESSGQPPPSSGSSQGGEEVASTSESKVILATSPHDAGSPSAADSAMSDSLMASSVLSDSSSSRTTAELWNEVKILSECLPASPSYYELKFEHQLLLEH
ncbi:hypothetical protein H0H93_010935 [Arthromyces matolae]|nr:hypothetical protein H0H93_010935 [Arthromyces matolae]